MRIRIHDTVHNKSYLCFQEHFDVVLVEDQTMDFPLALLAEIGAKQLEKENKKQLKQLTEAA
jgi:hypothetical protein